MIPRSGFRAGDEVGPDWPMTHARVYTRLDTGSVFPVGDVEALARAILKYRDEPFWMRKALNARQCAKTVFSLETMGEAVCEMYRDAVNCRGVCQNVD